MAQITLTIPDDQLTDVLDRFAIANGYRPGTETKDAFLKRRLISKLKADLVRGAALLNDAGVNIT